MAKDIIKVSYSRVSTYLRCPYSHYLRYIRKIAPKVSTRSLQFGKDMHTLMEHRGSSKEEIKQVFKELSIVYDNQPDWFKKELGKDYIHDLKVIFQDYRRRYKKADIPNATEVEFEIELGESLDGEKIIFNGFIDGLYFDESGKANEYTVIEEHKTFAQKPDAFTLLSSMQKYLYAKAVEEITGYMPAGILWDYIKNTPASEPKVLKSGKLSEAKSATVTPYSWRRACKKAGLTDKEYIHRGVELYEKNVDNFFFREYQSFNVDIVNQIYKDFKDVVSDIVNKGFTNKIKHCTKDCSWCDMKPICMAEFNGTDPEQVIAKEFTERVKK